MNKANPPPGARYIHRADIRLAGVRRPVIVQTLAKYGLALDMSPMVNALAITHCSGDKIHDEGKMTVDQMFPSKVKQRFFRKCNELGIPYAIMTAEYGVMCSWRSYAPYNTPPTGEYTDESLWEVGALMRRVCIAERIGALHYVGSPPSGCVPFLLRLLASGVPCTYNTNLKSLEQIRYANC